MQDDNDDDTYIAALRQAQEREAIRARNDAWLESAVMQPYREAGSPYGDGPAAAIRWFRQRHRMNQAESD
jgi:hypothetical protein